MDVTPLHDGHSKYEVPVRLTLPAEQQGELSEFLKLTLRAADGSLVPMSELVRVVQNDRERPIYHKDLLPVVYVVADQAGTHRQPALRHVRRARQGGRPGARGGRYPGRVFHPPAVGPVPRSTR